MDRDPASRSDTDDADPHSVGEVLDELDELADAGERVCVRDALDDFGERSFGPFIMVPALIEISPIGGIPGLPTLLALTIAVVAAQLVLGRDHVWLPGFIQKRSIDSGTLHRAVSKLRSIAAWLDRHSHERLEWVTQGLWLRITGGIVIVLCLTVPPLEIIPFASTLPMLAIVILGLALTVRDGALLLAAIAFSVVAAGVGITLYVGSDHSGGFLPF